MHESDPRAPDRLESDRPRLERRLRAWWERTASRTQAGGRPSPDQPGAVAPGRAARLAPLPVAPPADVLGTQVDGRFALGERTALKRATRRFLPARAKRSTAPPRERERRIRIR